MPFESDGFSDNVCSTVIILHDPWHKETVSVVGETVIAQPLVEVLGRMNLNVLAEDGSSIVALFLFPTLLTFL